MTYSCFSGLLRLLLLLGGGEMDALLTKTVLLRVLHL